MGQRGRQSGLVAFGLLIAAATGCGSITSRGPGETFTSDAGSDATVADAGHVGGGGGDAGASDSGIHITPGGSDAAAACTASSCKQLSANCGAVSDPKCGGVVQCGGCDAGEVCGGGGVHNQCGVSGSSPDSCVKQTCLSQSISCGQAGDGCGGTLSCGGCSAPQACGGDPTKPGVCGCTGMCAQVPLCDGGTTTLTGRVFDPAGVHGLYNALVYVPNDPNDPGLKPLPAGITCDVCGSTAAGNPLVSTTTAADGSFTLKGVPVGTSIPVVIQLGKWRRIFNIPIATACGANTVPVGTPFSMPKNHSQGDLPRIAIVSGSFDAVECVLLKIGVDTSEFSDPGGAGYFQFFTADDPSSTSSQTGAGAKYSASTPSQDALFATTGGPDGGPAINKYDMTIMECLGYPEPDSVAQQVALANYAGAGGRVFASDFQYTWFSETTSPLHASANWGGNHLGMGYTSTATIDQPPTNPTGADFQSWLQDVGVSTTGSGTVSITPAFPNVLSVIAPTQPWLHGSINGSTQPIHFTFNTPIGAPSANQCGRVTFSDWHAENVTSVSQLSAGKTFPTECPGGAMTPQEAILEFMLFDLSACVQPYTPVCTPTDCKTQKIQCGPAGDGCGGVLDCGACGTGQVCGGGGSGICGTTTTCTPETCASQHIQCGPAGDGCGKELQCGNCATGQICGLTSPGQCGAPTP